MHGIDVQGGEAVQGAVILPHLLVHTGVSTGGVRGQRRAGVSCLPALLQQLGRGAEVEAVEAGQRVEAGDSLVEAAGPELGEGEVGAGAGGLELLAEGGPRVSGGQEVEGDQQG